MPIPGLEKARGVGERNRFWYRLFLHYTLPTGARLPLADNLCNVRATLKSQRFYVFRRSSRALASMTLAPLPCGSDGVTNVAAPSGRSSVAAVSRALSLTIRGLIVQVSVRCAPCGSLLRRACARGRRQAVLLAGTAACSDRADDLPVHGDRNAAFGCHRFLREGHERRVARGILIGKGFTRPAEQHGGARLALGNLGRGELRAIHLFEIDELARGADDRERHAPIVLLGLGKRRGGDRLRLLVGDGRSVIGRRRRGRSGGRGRLLPQHGPGERQRRADAERDQDVKSHGPVSSWIVAALWRRLR